LRQADALHEQDEALLLPACVARSAGGLGIWTIADCWTGLAGAYPGEACARGEDGTGARGEGVDGGIGESGRGGRYRGEWLNGEDSR
jgi:hypothetical protein